MLIQMLTHQEDMTIINMHVPQNRALKQEKRINICMSSGLISPIFMGKIPSLASQSIPLHLPLILLASGSPSSYTL